MLTPVILVCYPGSLEELTDKVKKTFTKTVYQSQVEGNSDLETQLGLCTADIFVVNTFEPFLNNVIYKGYKTIIMNDQEEKIVALYPAEAQESARQWNKQLANYLQQTGIKDLATVVVVQDYNPNAMSWSSIEAILTL